MSSPARRGASLTGRAHRPQHSQLDVWIIGRHRTLGLASVRGRVRAERRCLVLACGWAEVGGNWA